MPAPPQITLGLRSSSGRSRITLSGASSGTALKSAIAKALDLSGQDFAIKKDAGGRPGQEVKMTRTATLASLKIEHGMSLYITPIQGTRFKADEIADDDANGTTPTGSGTMSRADSSASMMSMDTSEVAASIPRVVEDALDVTLAKETGRIEVGLTPQCQHRATGQKCLYCAAVEPYDEGYLKKEGIKFMSFHSYLRKQMSGMSGAKFAALDDIRCNIKSGCTTHKPWPQGICSKCQPPAITLNRQKYRHVDHIEFENADIVDQILAYWRNTGGQRIGFLYGRYEAFPGVPLGIKAVVSAIYEPPQECTRDSVKLVQSEAEESKVEEMATSLGLRRVGWIFTDLLPDSKGNVRHVRKAETHYLSAQECITAGHYQSKYPNPCKYSSEGAFGSKFVTVIVTGNAEKQVQMDGYQVSNQCMALSKNKCLVPTKDAPELGYVLESTDERYVPDVFYKEKDKYGNEVTNIARPLPVEYLLTEVPVATPLAPENTFYTPAAGKPRFPVENRPMEGHIQDFGTLASYRASVPALADFFRDFHVLLYLATQTVNPINMDDMRPLFESVRDAKADAVLAWANSEHWQTIELLLEAHNGGFS